MKRLAIYGMLTGLALAGWTYLEYVFGFHASSVGRYTGFLAFIIILLGLLLGIRAYREKVKGGVITYWEAVLAGMIITLLAGLIQAGFTYAYYVYINPGFVDFIVEKNRQVLAAHQATASQIAGQTRQIREYYQVLPLTMRTFGGFMAAGTILTLIMASLLKRYPQD